MEEKNREKSEAVVGEKEKYDRFVIRRGYSTNSGMSINTMCYCKREKDTAEEFERDGDRKTKSHYYNPNVIIMIKKKY